MPKRILPPSNVTVNKAKPKDSEYKLLDGYGLFLLVTPSGGKLWRFDYRIGDKRKTMALGQYPSLSLAEADDGLKQERYSHTRDVDHVRQD
jgi:hypothetical protein